MDLKPTTLLVLLASLFCLTGCDLITGKPSLLGTWEADDSPGYTLTFRADGTIVLTNAGEDFPTVDYAVDHGTTPASLIIDGEAGTVVFADQDHLTITDPHGDELSFHRIK